jgi:tripeptide aminopeptidase
MLNRRDPALAVTAHDLLGQAARRRDTHQAFQYFHLKEALFRQWHEKLVMVPAPLRGEAARADALAGILHEIGITDVKKDSEGNVLATLPGFNRNSLCVLLCAHLDTVFAADTPLTLQRDGDRIAVPGASDNGAGLTAMLAIGAAMQSSGMQPPCDVVIAGTVGEEGDGNLRGMRAIFASPLGRRVGAVIALDGAGSTSAVGEALGSHRYEIEIHGPGGHSWSDSDRPNPIVAMARGIAAFQSEALPKDPATTVNFATIQGGTAVNSIPQSVLARVDIRSVSQEELIRQEVRLHRAIEDAVASSRGEGRQRLRHIIRSTGERPPGALPERSFLAEAVRAVDRHLQLRTHWRIASTDANIPLSLGVPAISVGGGGTGGGAHTLEEWYDPAGRELALRRILLLVLTTAEHMAMEHVAAGARV